MDFHIEKVAEGEPLWPLVCEHFPTSVKYLGDPEDDGDYHFFVAVDGGGHFLGGAVIDVGPIDYGPLAGRMEGFLEDVEVAEARRRQGIGTALMRRVLDFAWELGAAHVRWTVSCTDPAAVAFYDRLGCAMLPERDEQNPDHEYYLVVAVDPRKRTTAGR
jgi:GNAT superfamily N-acetyltransferase